MAGEFIDVPGTIVSSDALELDRAKRSVAALLSETMHYATLVECLVQSCNPRIETIVVDLQPELPQICVHPIQKIERVAIDFHGSDNRVPEVFALRADFPLVPHLNLKAEEFPRSLCLYEESWEELCLKWTAPVFLEWIRQWLTLTARGELHQASQSLEPLLWGARYRLILPSAYDTNPDSIQRFVIGRASESDFQVLIAVDSDQLSESKYFLTFQFACPCQKHGVIRRAPRNLSDLDKLLRQAGMAFMSELRAKLSAQLNQRDYDASCIIVLSLPKSREEGGAKESTDTMAFVACNSISEIGIAIGLWDFHEGKRANLLSPDETKIGTEILLEPVNVTRSLAPNIAAILNGYVPVEDKIVAVGVGALGSQLVSNLARSGFGRWTLIDDDILLPHNTARHSQFGRGLGIHKAELVASDLNSLFPDKSIASSVCANVHRPGDKSQVMQDAFNDSDLILDCAASVSVSRYLAHASFSARRVAAFLNPSGTDVVVLTEPVDRSIKLDELEMTYMRAVALEAELDGHLPDPKLATRYGCSCRDVSSMLPQDLISVHAGVAGRVIRDAHGSQEAVAAVWRTNPDTMVTNRFDVAIQKFHHQVQGDWMLVVHPEALRVIGDSRRNELPNETGGVLIGSFDTSRRIAYVLHALLSPPDSLQWPNLFIRGCRHLPKQIATIRSKTLGNLDYVGEWHSHPDGCPTLPSNDDLNVFSWLTSHMAIEGRPALMLIAGQNDSRLFLGQMAGQIPEAICQ